MVNSYLENLIGREVSNTVIIDFDGTIIRESKELLFNFQNEPPLEGVIEGLQKLKENGYHIKIWSCRTSNLYPTEFRLMQIKMMEEYLKKYEIPYDSVLMIDKPFAYAYIDSRAIKPEWDHITEQLKNLDQEQI